MGKKNGWLWEKEEDMEKMHKSMKKKKKGKSYLAEKED